MTLMENVCYRRGMLGRRRYSVAPLRPLWLGARLDVGISRSDPLSAASVVLFVEARKPLPRDAVARADRAEGLDGVAVRGVRLIRKRIPSSHAGKGTAKSHGTKEVDRRRCTWEAVGWCKATASGQRVLWRGAPAIQQVEALRDRAKDPCGVRDSKGRTDGSPNSGYSLKVLGQLLRLSENAKRLGFPEVET